MVTFNTFLGFIIFVFSLTFLISLFLYLFIPPFALHRLFIEEAHDDVVMWEHSSFCDVGNWPLNLKPIGSAW